MRQPTTIIADYKQHRRQKRYADLMIAAMVVAGPHILVTRNRADFVDVLPSAQLVNRGHGPGHGQARTALDFYDIAVSSFGVCAA